MKALKSVEYPCLDNSAIRSFAQNRIITIQDFLQEDVEKLTAISKLSIQQISSLKKYILNKYTAVPINGTKFLQNTSKKYIKTHIENLDILLDGGIPVGFITEICGLADSGKSQLCLQTAINVSSDGHSNILYVDTKRDFSAVRVQRILNASGYSPKNMALIMNRIKVTHVWNMCELISLISKIQDKSLNIESLCLIIIDSLPCLMLQFLGDDNKFGLTLLNKLVNKLRYTSKELHVGILCVNIQTRWVDQDIVEVEENVRKYRRNMLRVSWSAESLEKAMANVKNKRQKKDQLIVTSKGQLPHWSEHFEKVSRILNDFLASTPAASLPSFDINMSPTTDGNHSSTSNTVSTGKTNRCLGRYWHFIPATVMLLEKNANEHNISHIKVSLARSLQVKEQNTCVLNMCTTGVK